MKPRILVVEDEPAIRMGLCDVMVFHGWEPTPAEDGRIGLQEVLSREWDLLLLDVMLPEVDGFTLCRVARERHPRQPILMLTARGTEQDVLDGFAAGADDYVQKPFSVAQVVARIKALLRRSGAMEGRVFELGGVHVDAARLQARGEGQVADLNPRDVEILARMAADPGKVFSREELLQEVWGYRCVSAVETRCVDMHMTKLRRKLAVVSADPLIATVRGAGYRLRSE